ncbi:MAG: hypothetical protein AB7E60_14000 [Sphingobium sp.]
MTVLIFPARKWASPPALTPDDRTTAQIALYAAALLRNSDAVALSALGNALTAAARDDIIPHYTDNSHLVRIMQRLGWRKDGYVGAGRSRSPLYIRVVTPIADR